MHTDDTLQIFDENTKLLGAEFRAFTNTTCPAFDTRELDREVDARKRRKEKQEQGRPSTSKGSATDGARYKEFNLQIYKYHSLGDYADTIQRCGTTDSYSTEPVGTASL